MAKPKTRTYKTLPTEARDQMRAQRIGQLEQEHYANQLAYEELDGTVPAAPPATATDDEKALHAALLAQHKARQEQLEHNLETLGKALDKLERKA